MNDSLLLFTKVLDSLKVIVTTPSKDPTFWTNFAPYVPVVTLFLGTGMGLWGSNFLQAKQFERQKRSESDRELFKIRLEIYRKAAELLGPVYSVKIDSNDHAGQERPYPIAYENPKKLGSWINDAVEFFDRNRLFLDDKTYKAFEVLNRITLGHKREFEKVTQASQGYTNDEGIRNSGRDNVGEIQKKVNDIMNSMRSYLMKAHGVQLENVTVSG